MGVCLEKNCIKSKQQKLKESICIDINDNRIITDINNNNEDNKEKQNSLEDNQLTDENKKNQIMTKDNGYIYFSFQSRYKSKFVKHPKTYHLNNNYSNNNYINIETNDKCENLIQFTNFMDKKVNHISRITNTTTK